MAEEGRSPWTLGYSGGTVPDSHRIPCSPAVAGRDARPPTPIAPQIIRTAHRAVNDLATWAEPDEPTAERLNLDSGSILTDSWPRDARPRGGDARSSPSA